jgi:hypothetical protein
VQQAGGGGGGGARFQAAQPWVGQGGAPQRPQLLAPVRGNTPPDPRDVVAIITPPGGGGGRGGPPLRPIGEVREIREMEVGLYKLN